MTELIAHCDFFVFDVVVFGGDLLLSSRNVCYHFRIIYIHFIINWHFFSLSFGHAFSLRSFYFFVCLFDGGFHSSDSMGYLRKTNAQCNSNSTGIVSIKIERKFIETKMKREKKSLNEHFGRHLHSDLIRELN